ncbi:MAG: Hsp20/alpha crystallin family protein [Planctomycetes bacterium]|nr:Hsp20/alpha crystallin family protein [Planctomycetota bacterium]
MLTRWMPTIRTQSLPPRREPFLALHDQMNRLFDDVLRGFGGEVLAPDGETALAVVPRLDLAETPEELRVVVELPGVSPDDVKVTLEDGVLSVSGEFKSEEKREDESWLHVERRAGSFLRRVPVHVPVDEEHVDATFDKGVLTVRLPKSQKVEEKARQIPVKSL